MSVWAVGIFRFGKWVMGIRFGPLRKALLAVYFLLYKISEALSGIRLSIYSEIGAGLVVHNFGGVIIRGRLGRNCTIVQGAQLISRSDGKDSGWPTLGDNVYVGSGAKVLGNVHVGNNVRIGANAVVMADVPDDSLVLPPESKVIRGFYRRKAAPDEPAAAE
jgi:serine O-acetyltransferase